MDRCYSSLRLFDNKYNFVVAPVPNFMTVATAANCLKQNVGCIILNV